MTALTALCPLAPTTVTQAVPISPSPPGSFPGQGISSYANNPPEAGNSLRECLDKALQVVPAEKQRDAPAYLGATAGMRLLRYCCGAGGDSSDNAAAATARTDPSSPSAMSKRLGREGKGKRQPGGDTGMAELS